MSAALGLALSTRSGLAPHALAGLARHAEDEGYRWFACNEAGNDALATAGLLLGATTTATVATGIANLYLRHPAVAAAAAVTLHEASAGRFVLGLGTGHARDNAETLGIPMGSPLEALREYLTLTRALVRGETVSAAGPRHQLSGARLAVGPAAVPLYVAALGPRAAGLAGELADGVIANFATPAHVRRLVAAVRAGEARAGRPPGQVVVVAYLQAVPDGHDAEDAARAALAGYLRFDFYRRMLRASGFDDEVDAFLAAPDAVAATTALPARLLREVMVLGDTEQWAERITAYRAAGVDLPVVYPNHLGDDPERAIRKALAQGLRATAG